MSFRYPQENEVIARVLNGVGNNHYMVESAKNEHFNAKLKGSLQRRTRMMKGDYVLVEKVFNLYEITYKYTMNDIKTIMNENLYVQEGKKEEEDAFDFNAI